MYTDYVYPAFVSLLADISCLLFLFRKRCFLFFLSFPLLFHHAFFLFSFLSLVYWPFRTRLLACLIRAAILHFSFRLQLSSVVLRRGPVRVPLFFPKPCTIRWCTGKPSFCLPFGFYFSHGCFHLFLPRFCFVS